jgi:hypothetical protein
MQKAKEKTYSVIGGPQPPVDQELVSQFAPVTACLIEYFFKNFEP